MSKLVQRGSKYTDEDRRRAVVEYCVNGNMTKVSDQTGIPQTTLSHWKRNTDWWVELVAEVRTEIGDQILSQNLQIATKAGERVLDSLENGDEKLVWDKNKGEHVIKRVKPTGKDSMVMSGISQDKARVQLNLPTSISSNVGSEQHLEELMQKFKNLARSYDEKRVNSIPGEAVEVTDLALESATKNEANIESE